MNPNRKDLIHRMSRIVPNDMLDDPEFQRIVQEKIAESAPSDASSEREHHSNKQQRNKKTARRLARAATQPANLVQADDPDMIPALEHRYANPPGDGQTVVQEQQQQQQLKELLRRHALKLATVTGIILFFAYIYLRRQLMARELGVTYAIAAEFPFLANAMTLFSGVPAVQIRGEIAQYEAGAHPIQIRAELPPFQPPPEPERQHSHEEQLAKDQAVRQANIEKLVAEALQDTSTDIEPVEATMTVEKQEYTEATPESPSENHPPKKRKIAAVEGQTVDLDGEEAEDTEIGGSGDEK